MYFDYFVTHPTQCTDAEIENIYRLLLNGGQVSPEGLMDTVLNCKKLGLCTLEDKIIGIIGLKELLESERRYIFKSCGVEHLLNQYIYELGFGYTDPNFRGQGILNKLADLVMANITTGVYGTTSIPTIKKMLERWHFKKVGKSYLGKYYQKEARELYVRPIEVS